MKIHKQASKVLASALALVCISQAALATWDYTPGKGIKVEYAEGKAFTAAMDVRLRLTHIDRNVIWPEGPPVAALNGDALEWLRVRTRLSLGLDLWDGAKLNARFVNRMHNYSSHFIDENDNGAGTWQYPDEIILDQLKLTLTSLGVEGLSATLGRQAFILGNGMVMLEGTPYDQGRTIYFDGISIRYKNECDALALFAFYSEAEDEFVIAGDEDRVLRRGDIFTTGIDWTHTFNNSLSSELYYIYANVDDNDTTAGMREFPSNSNAELHTVGARLFGSPHERLSYSVEVAHMFGEYDASPAVLKARSLKAADMDAWMVDARLTFKSPEVKFQPVVMFEYTWFSGDDADTDDYEGWDGLFANYPIFREELMPIMNNGNWTNLHQFRLQGTATLYSNPERKLFQSVKLTGTAAYLMADDADTAMTSGGGTGDSHFGDLYSAFLDVKVNAYISFALEAAAFEAGDYWDTSADSEWVRFQTVLSF